MNRRTHDEFFKQIYNKKYHSVFTSTLGPNQSGKTHFNLYQMIMLEQLGLYRYFGSNMPDLDLPFKYDFIEDFPTLKQRCQALNPDPKKHGLKRYLMNIEEFAKLVPQDQPWLNVKMISELQTVRKYGLSLLSSGISRIDRRVLNEKHFHGYFMKVSKKKLGNAVYVDWFNNRKAKIYDIPPLPFGYDTWYSAMFYMEKQTDDPSLAIIQDRDIQNAINKANGFTHKRYLAKGGDLSKQGFYNSVDKGIIKLYAMAKSTGQQVAS